MTVLRKSLGDDQPGGWCGIGALISSRTLHLDGQWIPAHYFMMISRHSELAQMKPPVLVGDFIMAVRDERVGDRWIPMSESPKIVGPQDTQVELRIRRAATGEMVDVKVMRGAFDLIYDGPDSQQVKDIVRSRNALQNCVMSEWQGDPVAPLRTLALLHAEVMHGR